MKSLKICSVHRRLRPAIIVSFAVGLTACNTPGPQKNVDETVYRPVPMHASATKLASLVKPEKLTTAARQLALEGIRSLDARDYGKASQLFNLALKIDLNNSYLHLLNGISYHLRGLAGEGSLYTLAEQGYEMAIQFDQSNAIARKYLGLLLLDRRDFGGARDRLMEAALYARKDADLLYDLAVAAYYAKDARTASAALEGLRRLEGNNPAKRTLRASAIVAAATGDHATAQRYLEQLAAAGIPAQEREFVGDRIDAWQESYTGGLIKTQFPTASTTPATGGFPVPGAPVAQPATPATPFGAPAQLQPFGASGQLQPFGGQAGAPPRGGVFPGQPGAPAAFFDKKMVNLDVVIIATEEDNNDTFGVNLLDGLRLQFGDSTGTPAVRASVTRNRPNASSWSVTREVTRVIQIPGITYTLNIANAQDRRNEVLARPSLVAMGGQTSTFFSGTDVIGAAVSTGQGGSVQVQKEAGVKLSVTPEFMPDDLIRLQVSAERTFLTNPNSNVLFDFRLDTSKTLVNANVALKYGETLILSGLSERNIESDNSGVPVLRDVPLVQYLFSRQTKRDFHKSVLILITPRRPSYTNRSEQDIAAERKSMSEFDRVQAQFEDKYKLWFKPVPNLAASTKVLETSPIYREFRSGDLAMESWTSRASHGGRLRAALQFLYY